MLLFVLLSGTHPYDNGESEKIVNNKVLSNKLDFGSKSWANVSPASRSMVEAMLTTDETKRITVDGALRHEWMNAFTEQSLLSVALNDTLSEIRRYKAQMRFKKGVSAIIAMDVLQRTHNQQSAVSLSPTTGVARRVGGNDTRDNSTAPSAASGAKASEGATIREGECGDVVENHGVSTPTVTTRDNSSYSATAGAGQNGSTSNAVNPIVNAREVYEERSISTQQKTVSGNERSSTGDSVVLLDTPPHTTVEEYQSTRIVINSTDVEEEDDNSTMSPSKVDAVLAAIPANKTLH